MRRFGTLRPAGRGGERIAGELLLQRLPAGVAVALLAIAMSACGKTDVKPQSNVKPVAVAPAKASASASEASNTKLDAEISKALSTPPPAAQAGNAREAELSVQADDILKRYPTKDAAELLGTPEVSEHLKAGLKRLGEDPSLGKQIESTVSLAAKLKGLEGAPGSFRLDMDIKSYDKPRTKRMLETVLSEDPKRIVSFLSEEIGEATPELSLGGAKRASNGVAIEANPTPAPPPKN
ncbi:MAG: hypothetical protein K1X78_07635 [Verrucomicrobiaceae bacterium]|nr:hypothetical protein [Verrucomicrobiaceae bacterium]